MNPEEKAEWLTCAESPLYFTHKYCYLFNATEEQWMIFDLWPAQAKALRQIHNNRLTVLLKARQLGLSWLMLSYALWLMLFRPSAVIGIFSRRAEEAQELLDQRLKGIHARLPEYMQAPSIVKDNLSRWEMSNGSMAMAFPTTGGRSYTFAMALVDEADFQPDLPSLMTAVKPTIDAGGRMALISTADKGEPNSRFKAIYRAAKRGENEWTPIFLPWNARPERTPEWYEAQRRDTLANTGALDDLHQEYPATDAEALAPRSLDKRIPAIWVERNFYEAAPLAMDRWPKGAPAIPGLIIYRRPEPGRRYVLGVDPAEGNPTSDDSAITVLDYLSGEEVATLAGKFQPSTLASYANTVGMYFNRATVMVERNNHGHAVLLWLQDNGRLPILEGHDERPGWNSSTLGKSLLYEKTTDAFRNDDASVHTFTTYMQLVSIEGSTLRAPEGEHDDRADSYALAVVGRLARARGRGVLAQATAKGW